MRFQLKIIALLMVTVSFFTTIGNGFALANQFQSEVGETLIYECIKSEAIITENRISEFITEEIYLQEMVLAESKISELLLKEESINEVFVCKTIYVSQGHIGEFANNSQTAQLFGDGIDVAPLLTKVAVGTGVIVTLVILQKVGLQGPVASIVATAADSSLKFAESGAIIGSLYGGFAGAADVIDESGRASAITGFAITTVGLILSIVSLVASVPSGGISSVGAVAGVKMVLAGVSVLTATVGTAYSGFNAIKSFQATDASEINWDNIDWNSVGVSSIEKAINYGSDGYMWGALVGSVYGGVEGYESYHKYNTPYTDFESRLKQTPSNGLKGEWSGERGKSDYALSEPIELQDGSKITSVSYKNGIPDFSPYQKAEVRITNLTEKRTGKGGNYEQADTVLSKKWSSINYDGHSWTSRQVAEYREKHGLTWHEMSNMEYMQLVPYELNSTFTHSGGVAEYKTMLGQEGAFGYD